MVEFLHVADLHLKERTWKHRRGISGDAFCAFDQIMKYTLDHGVKILVLSGDIFDSRYPSDVDVRACLSRMEALQAKDVQVLVISGNHDQSVEQNWACMPGVNVLHLGGRSSCLQINGLSFYGLDFTPQSRLMEEMVRIPAEADVVVMHQMLVEAAGGLYPGDLSAEDLPSARDRWRYYALGDYHGSWEWRSDERKVIAAYPGSIYPTSVSEFKSKSFYHVSMEPGGCSEPVLKTISLTSRQLIKVSVEGVESLPQAVSEAEAQIKAGEYQEIARPVLLVDYATFPGAASLINDKLGELDAYLILRPHPSNLADLNIEAAESTDGPVSLSQAIRDVMDQTFDKDTAGLTQELLESTSPADVLDEWKNKFMGA